MAFRFTLSSSSGIPYYRQIVNQVIFGVANGMLEPGEQLPTVRQLAVTLQVNLNTIAKAYSELELRGVVNTQQGTGTFISETSPELDPKEKEKGLERLCRTFLDEAAALGANTQEAITVLNQIEKKHQNNKTGR
jgi:GntR family transcriptional regulator